METIEITSTQDDVCIIKMNRPKLNAMNRLLFKELTRCFTEIKANSTRAVIICSRNANVFTAGLDLKDAQVPGAMKGDPARESLVFQDYCNSMQIAFTAIELCNKPTIAAVAGYCIGGGIDMITACDIRYATQDAIFSAREVNLGLAADLGTLQRLPKVVGNQSWVREVCFTGRDFTAHEALKYGLISRIFENYDQLLQGCIELANEIASKAPLAIYGTKHLLLYSRDHSVDDSLRYTSLWNSVMLNSPDTAKATNSALSKQPVRFGKL